ncbi:hypothetical protein [Tenggerimyces flavus]|uniref:OmpA-like domain-containing protein n=1 Tax=Tenggerimyces flavus TaxID=1708749 RepID=A0ABV7Y8U2_9ACTN|nr:hypothetical protein [Tenggerimyces flavus]MBM7788355.1 type VI secretion system protein ImpK [Tenggerimyces flavus]
MTVLDVLQAQLALSRAAEAAQRGSLESAGDELVALDEAGAATPELLDLLARIRAQQERWSEADTYWARLQDLRPDDPAAAAGRETVAAIVAGRRRPRPVAPVAGAVAGVAVVAALAFGAVRLGDVDQPPTRPAAQSTGSPVPTADPTVNADRERAEELAAQLAAIEARSRSDAAALAAKLDQLSRQVAGPGVVVRRQSGAVRVLFSQGLYAYGTALTPTGRDALTALGKRLSGLDAAITVVGHSVALPDKPTGGSTTALARARTATRELSEASGLPLAAFTLQAADQRETPFRTARQNRTVTVLLTPRAA